MSGESGFSGYRGPLDVRASRELEGHIPCGCCDKCRDSGQ